jgi:hypothetical protein
VKAIVCAVAADAGWVTVIAPVITSSALIKTRKNFNELFLLALKLRFIVGETFRLTLSEYSEF